MSDESMYWCYQNQAICVGRWRAGEEEGGGGGSLALGKDQPPLSYTGEGTEHRQGEASREAEWTMPSVVTVREEFTSRKTS